jgi:integrase
MTFGKLIDRYLLEIMPELKHSTQTTNLSLLELHIRPKRGEYRLASIEAYEVEQWIKALHFGVPSKVRTRNMVGRLMDLAMLWKYLPPARNPMELIKIKGGTKRKKRLVITTPMHLR